MTNKLGQPINLVLEEGIRSFIAFTPPDPRTLWTDVADRDRIYEVYRAIRYIYLSHEFQGHD